MYVYTNTWKLHNIDCAAKKSNWLRRKKIISVLIETIFKQMDHMDLKKSTHSFQMKKMLIIVWTVLFLKFVNTFSNYT